MRTVAALTVSTVLAVGAGYAWTQNAEAEKMIIANERAVNEAVAKSNLAAFKQHVAMDAWTVDPMEGRAAVADFMKQFDAMAKDMKMSSWDITDSKVQWVDANTAIHTYKWTGSGTYQGQPIPSPVWSSTVWTKKGDKWMAVFHQETLPMAAPKK